MLMGFTWTLVDLLEICSPFFSRFLLLRSLPKEMPPGLCGTEDPQGDRFQVRAQAFGCPKRPFHSLSRDLQAL